MLDLNNVLGFFLGLLTGVMIIEIFDSIKEKTQKPSDDRLSNLE